MNFLISIQSKSDIITNSSSELFACSSNKTQEELFDIIKEFHNKHINDESEYITGMGGIIEVQEIPTEVNKKKLKNIYGKNCTPDLLKWFDEKYKQSYGYKGTGKIYNIDIDEGFNVTINFIKNILGGKYVD